jgi:hypothetical protein
MPLGRVHFQVDITEGLVEGGRLGSLQSVLGWDRARNGSIQIDRGISVRRTKSIFEA